MALDYKKPSQWSAATIAAIKTAIGLTTNSINNTPGRTGASSTLDFSLYDDFVITCGTEQQLTIVNDIEGLFFKTFELTGGSLNATLFKHATKSITFTENATIANYDAAEVNDLVCKIVVSASAIVIDGILKVRS